MGRGSANRDRPALLPSPIQNSGGHPDSCSLGTDIVIRHSQRPLDTSTFSVPSSWDPRNSARHHVVPVTTRISMRSRPPSVLHTLGLGASFCGTRVTDATGPSYRMNAPQMWATEGCAGLLVGAQNPEQQPSRATRAVTHQTRRNDACSPSLSVEVPV